MLGFPDTTDHGSLGGLGDDDHLQYLLIDGARAMTGPLFLADATALPLNGGLWSDQYPLAFFDGNTTDPSLDGFVFNTSISRTLESIFNVKNFSADRMDLSGNGRLSLTPAINTQGMKVSGSWGLTGQSLVELDYTNTGGFFITGTALKITALAGGSVNAPVGIDIACSDNGAQSARGIRVTNATNNALTGFQFDGNIGGNAFQRGFLTTGAGIGFEAFDTLSIGFASQLPEPANRRHFSAETGGVGEVAFIDGFGNIYKTGSLIDYKSASGTLENQCQYSDDMTGADWTSTNITVNQDALASPDGEPGIVDELVGTSNAFQDCALPSLGASANKTVTVSFWWRHITNSGDIARIRLKSSNEQTQTQNLPIGVGVENLWFFITYTGTFSGASTGNIELEIKLANNHTCAVAGVRAVEGGEVRGYVPTYGFALDPLFGVAAHDTLYLSSSQNGTQQVIREGADQGAKNMLEFWDQAGNTQLAIAPNGRDVILDAVTGTKFATATNQRLGFWNATPIVQPTITGSRGGNAAVASIASTLATLGLVVDNTTA